MPTFTVFKGSKEGALEKSTTTRPDQLTGDYVLVKVAASGVCGTDLHYRHAGIALGHEGAGVVVEVGPDAKTLKKGDRVGWGYIHGSCGHCYQCLSGQEVYCAQRELYGYTNTDQGSFGSHAIWHETFLHRIPDTMSDEDAAPLQCGGATVFTPLRDVRAGETVGVLGVGGLGHLAIQFAAKLGCRVVVLSGSADKRQQALDLGAHEFLALKNGDKLEDGKLINKLLVTTSAQPDWSAIVPMMAMKSKIYTMAVSFDDLKIPYMPLVVQGISLQGSLVATRAVHREMLDFAALHGIRPMIEKFPMTEEGVKTAMDKLTEGDVRYRAVLMAQE